MKAIIVGAGTYGEVYASYIGEDGFFEIVGFLDDDQAKQGIQVRGLPVLGTSQMLYECRRLGVQAAFVPIGNNTKRLQLLEMARGANLVTPPFIHRSANVSVDATIGEAVYILPQAVVMPYAVIEDGCMISMNCSIAHHTVIRQGGFVSTGVNLGANIRVGPRAFLGIGCTVMTGVRQVGEDAVVGAGAVVIKSVPDGATVVGVPARELKQKVES